MLKKATACFLCLLSMIFLPACGGRTQQSAGDGKVKVSVSFNAMKELTSAVGGNRVDISTMVPDGSEPHGFEPKAGDLTALGNARVFVINGLGMETWAEKAAEASGNHSLVTVEASKGAEPIRNSDSGEIQEHGQYDPHLWLSLKGAQTEAENIRDGLCKADPADAGYFRKNCSAFAAQLESLGSEYQAKFKAAKDKSFVTGHAAFAYLCRDFGLKQNSVEDVFADGEPSAKKLTELINYCKQNKVKTIFVESMVSPTVSQALAQEVGAKVEKIYTMESSENRKSYLERMEANLQEIDGSMSR